jgi:hypothetical protein
MRKSFPHSWLFRTADRSPSGEDIMKNKSILSASAAGQADHAALADSLDLLVREELSRSLSIEAMTVMLDGGIAGLASLANAASVAEGRLLEKIVAAIAESNPDLSVFTQVRLPVREDALELVDKNPETLYRGLTLDANARTRKAYIADLVLVDRNTRVAHVVDLKRSLGSYEAARILELRQRMLAAALVAPDLLWKDHQRVAVDEVRVVILEAAGKRTDVRNGIWSFAHLDHLVGVPGAAKLVQKVRQDFERLTEQALADARERLRRKQAEVTRAASMTMDALEIADDSGLTGAFSSGTSGGDGHVVGKARTPKAPRIGVAPPPPIMAH